MTAKSYSVSDLSLAQLEAITASPGTLGAKPSNSLTREGLRQFESRDVSISLESTSGYQIAIKNKKHETWVITGPTEDPTQTSNLSFAQTTQWLESVQKQTMQIQDSLQAHPVCPH